MSIIPFDKNKKTPPPLPELYTEREAEQVEAYIEKTFGRFEHVFHEIVSLDIHVDIALIDPTPAQPWYTLVTMGMGAHRMNVPPELADYRLERAEIIVRLPATWQFENQDEQWYWPIRWLKILARLPIEEDSWLAFGHSVPNGGPFADNTALCCALLISPTEQEREILTLDDGDVITFYQMLPLYEEEMDYKVEHEAAQPLLDKFSPEDLHGPVVLNRRNYCAE